MTAKHVPTYYEITGYYYPKSSHITYDLDYQYRHLHYATIDNDEETKLKIKRLIVINRQLKQQYLTTLLAISNYMMVKDFFIVSFKL